MPTQTIDAVLASKPQERKLSKKSIIYLACPYTNPDVVVREQRFQAATQAAASLIGRGYIVYSPITMTHPIDMVFAGDSATLGSEYWVIFDEAFMDLCSELVVLKLNGWDRSAGIQREIKYFEAQGKPVRFIAPSEHAMSHADTATPKRQKYTAAKPRRPQIKITRYTIP
jgi:hypothetical protein